MKDPFPILVPFLALFDGSLFMIPPQRNCPILYVFFYQFECFQAIWTFADVVSKKKQTVLAWMIVCMFSKRSNASACP